MCIREAPTGYGVGTIWGRENKTRKISQACPPNPQVVHTLLEDSANLF